MFCFKHILRTGHSFCHLQTVFIKTVWSVHFTLRFYSLSLLSAQIQGKLHEKVVFFFVAASLKAQWALSNFEQPVFKNLILVFLTCRSVHRTNIISPRPTSYPAKPTLHLRPKVSDWMCWSTVQNWGRQIWTSCLLDVCLVAEESVSTGVKTQLTLWDKWKMLWWLWPLWEEMSHFFFEYWSTSATHPRDHQDVLTPSCQSGLSESCQGGRQRSSRSRTGRPWLRLLHLIPN